MAPALPLPWDNDGLLVCADGARPMQRLLLSLDVTAGAVRYAVQNGFDAILSHHPFLFSPLRRVSDEDEKGRQVLALLQGDVAVFSYHTRLDAAVGGVNDVLAARLGLRETVPFGEGNMGRVGTVTETTADAFALTVRQALDAPTVSYADGGRPVRRVAVLGGEGKDLIADAAATGADLFLSGSLGYHPLTDVVQGGMTLMQAGHYETEAPVLEVLEAWAKEAVPGVYTQRFASNVIQTAVR